MPNISNVLCNPTPFKVTINWHAGIKIIIPPDDTVDLSVEQMDDFREGKPGSEEVKILMDSQGIFLRDHSRSYESQCLESLRASVRFKQQQYTGFVENLKRNQVSQGIANNPEAFEETLRQSGHSHLKNQIDSLNERIKFLSSKVESEEEIVTEKLDLERTLMFTDPPKIFPNKLSLEMFLNDKGNETLKKEYAKQMKAFEKTESV